MKHFIVAIGLSSFLFAAFAKADNLLGKNNGTAPGVCTYTTPSELQVRTLGPLSYDCVETKDKITSVFVNGNLYLNNEAVRNYTASVTISPAVSCKSNSDNHLENANADALRVQYEQKVIADCNKLELGGVCVCLGSYKN